MCVCVSAGIWRVKGLRLGAVGVERRVGGGGGEHPKWERVPHEGLHKIYIIPTSAVQFVHVELSHRGT